MTAPLPIVLVVEDEAPVRRFLRATLGAEYRVVEAETGSQALALAASWNPEVVLLDLGLPDVDGLDVTRRLREWSAAPIIVLSARGREADKVAALDAGADDYLTKPFGASELLARLRVAFRHAARRSGPEPEPVVSFDDVTVDLEKRLVTRAGAEVRLTPLEYRLLAVLAKHAGKVVTQKQLLRDVWGPNASEPHYLRVYMAQLRAKLEVEPARPRWLTTEPGVGYRLKAE